ncbi:MAG: polysaccharide deacetylase family protein [Longispora sp.]|nr:polysaccharide deacetylase family protein [Longispora sp. (in: high G+C Gram-positive bacteria)]
MQVTGSEAVALTFDDGPDPVNTPKVLDLLAQYGVKATFCMVGTRARDYPGLVRRIVAEGHTVCNHSWQHRLDLARHNAGFITQDLQATNDTIHRAAPGAKITYFRAPGGNFTPQVVDIAASMGMTSLYWDVDPRDWDSATYGTGTPMVNHIISAANRAVRPGSIVLSHDSGHPDTVVAYRTLLARLTTRFRLIALP